LIWKVTAGWVICSASPALVKERCLATAWKNLQSTISHKYSPFYNADQIQSQNGFAGQRQSERGVLATPGQANNSPAFVV
jgi:hypothetical protein